MVSMPWAGSRIYIWLGVWHQYPIYFILVAFTSHCVCLYMEWLYFKMSGYVSHSFIYSPDFLIRHNIMSRGRLIKKLVFNKIISIGHSSIYNLFIIIYSYGDYFLVINNSLDLYDVLSTRCQGVARKFSIYEIGNFRSIINQKLGIHLDQQSFDSHHFIN